jgi:hypothetical protein
MISRRGFIGIVGAALLSWGVPVNVLPAWSRQDSAIAYLTKLWNAECKGKGWERCPKTMYVGSDLFDAFEGELIASARFVDHYWGAHRGFKTLKFKSATMFREGSGSGVRFV